MAEGVLVIVIDCLRADHVSAHGYDRETTPTLDGLARGGLLWEHAHSVSSWTKPSVTSMLTGLYPTEHGAFEGIKRSKGKLAATTDILQSNAPTLAESFAAAGWRCGAFINNAQLGEFSRLNRGFHVYDPSAGKADRILDSLGKWLDQERGARTFTYLHFLEAHWPYKPRRRHMQEFGGDRDTNYFRDFSARDFGKLRQAIARKEAKITEDQLTQMIRMYDAAVRRLDGKIKLAMKAIDERGLRDKMAVFVTADHGEEFMDHGRIGHGQSVYDELTHVPLVASIPGGACGVRHANPVSHVNLAKTLLAVGGVDNEMPGVDLTGEVDTDAPVFAELRVGRRYVHSVRKGRWKLHRTYKFQPQDGELDRSAGIGRLIDECPHKVHIELYDTVMDRSEREDLSGDTQYESVGRMLLDELDGWWRKVSSSAVEHDSYEIDDSLEERIRALGYVD